MRRLIFLIFAGALLLPAAAMAAGLPQPSALENGASYIAGLQQPGGGFGGASVGQDADAIIAIRSAGYDPSKLVASDGKTPADFVAASAKAAAAKPADAAKLALAAVAVGDDPTNIGGTDLVGAIDAGFDASTGRYAGDDFSQSIAMLGLACTGGGVPAAAVNALKAAQIQSDGGWGFQGTSDPDTTAIAVQALLASGVPRDDPAVVHGLAYLAANQLSDGGWGYAPSSNVNSTAYAMQALLAAGLDPAGAAYTRNGVNPVDYLLSQEQADGSFAGFSAALATEQVLPALAGRTFCNAAQTAITREGAPPVETVSSAATASATATPPASSTPASTTAAASPTGTASPRPATNVGGAQTPAPPNTGSGSKGSGTPAGAILGPAIGLLALSIVASALAAKRRI